MAADEEAPWTWDRVHQEINLIEKHYDAAREAIQAQHQHDSDAARNEMQTRSRRWYARSDVPQDAREEIFELLQDKQDERIKQLEKQLKEDLLELEENKRRESSNTWVKLHRGSGFVRASFHPSRSFSFILIFAAS